MIRYVLDQYTNERIQRVAAEQDEIMRLVSCIAFEDDPGRRAFGAKMVHEAGERIAESFREIAAWMRGDDDPVIG